MNRTTRKTFIADEKQLIINFIKKNKSIIENKNNDMKLVKEKKQKWEELSQIFAVKGYDRDPQRLREYYHRMKCNAKAIIRSYQKHIKYNDTIPVQVPSEFDWAIFEIVREDIIEEDDDEHGDTQARPDENSEDAYSEEMNISDNGNEIKEEKSGMIIDQKRNETHRTAKKLKIENHNNEQSLNSELELLKYKKELELQLYNEKIKLAREKHRKEMENVILLQKKLQMELDAATVTKIKMEKEAEKLDREMILLQHQIDNI